MPIRVHLVRTRYRHWGARSGFHQFVKYLDSDRYEVSERAVPDSDQDFPIRHRWVAALLRSAVQAGGMRWYKLSDLNAEMLALFPAAAVRIDLLHYLDGEHSAQFLPWLLKGMGKQRPKLLATYHQPPEVLDSLIIRKVIARLDAITVVSPEQAAYFRNFLPSDRVRLIPHGVDTDFFKPAHATEPDGKLRCLTVGHYLRDFNAVRKVAQRFLNSQAIEFHVVSSEAAGLGDLPNVRIYNGIDDAGLLKLYQHSDILFLPLLQATANNALLEGIACGLPVVSSRLPSVRFYLPGEEAILIDDNDTEQFTETIADLWRHSEKRDAMRRAARRRAEALDWHRIAPDFAAAYDELTGDHN